MSWAVSILLWAGKARQHLPCRGARQHQMDIVL